MLINLSTSSLHTLIEESTFTSGSTSDTIEGMGRAGKALKDTLTAHKISQNKLAVVLGVDRAVVNRWFHEQVDPSAETVVEIVEALKKINSVAAEAFVQLYLGDLVERDDSADLSED